MQARHIALGGILSALTLVFLYLSVLFGTNTLTFMTLASFMVPIALMRSSLRTAFMVFITSSLLAFILVPVNTALMYTLFFGIYGLIKYFIEKLRRLSLEIILKLCFFNCQLILISFLMYFQGYDILNMPKNFIQKYSFLNIPYLNFIFIGFGVQLAFLVFDYGLTLLIDYYNRFMKKY